ncbi:hypothetical protein [Curtobacterium sp. MCSS17_006]|uniref:hypothetical protein n=1 Tax=Curtobacterium sp. MCSS17_006 TaxID=2175642 RepID=UPI0011B54CA3|nr:hypothetical protein [Curtobacterium sp. MCSS17_006]
MRTFRVVQAGKSVDIAAQTVMEARARAVLSGDFTAGDSLIAYPEGEAPPAATATTAAAVAEPAFEAERVQPSFRRQGPLGPGARFRQVPIGRQLLSLLLLVVLLFAVLIGGGWWITVTATTPGPLGECAQIGLCTNTPLTTVTVRTGVQFPDGTQRLRSTASRDGSWISALVQLSAGAAAPTLDGGTSAAVTDRAAAALESAGATERTGMIAGPVGVFSGTADGRTVVYVRFDDPDR